MPTAESREEMEPTLFAVLAAHARVVSDGRLALDVMIGLLSVAAILALAPSWWLGALPFVVLAAFGSWGITDRTLAERGANADRLRGTALRALKAIAAGIGLLAALGFGFGILGVVFANWIH